MKYSIGEKVLYQGKLWEIFQYNTGLYYIKNKDAERCVQITELEIEKEIDEI